MPDQSCRIRGRPGQVAMLEVEPTGGGGDDDDRQDQGGLADQATETEYSERSDDADDKGETTHCSPIDVLVADPLAMANVGFVDLVHDHTCLTLTPWGMVP